MTLVRLADHPLDRGRHAKAPSRGRNFQADSVVGEIVALTRAKNPEIRAERLISAYRDSSLPLIQ